MDRLQNGSVLITRVVNGWKVAIRSDFEDDPPHEFVFQDGDGDEDMAIAVSLRSALYEAFDGYVQSKHRAGIRIDACRSRIQEELAEEESPSP